MQGYHDYLIILSPPEYISDEVKKLKDKSEKIIGNFDGQTAKANISIQQWPRKRPVWVEPLLPKLERDLQTLPPLVLDINGFDFFDQQEFQTIYAKLTSTAATKLWFKLLRRFFNAPPFEPHIIITRNIPHDNFMQLWPLFKTRQWNELFSIDKLTILRRETIGYDKTFKPYKEIFFNKKLDFFDFTNVKLKQPAMMLSKKDDRQFSLF
ncbi:hypothetical protein [uncultured Mucilaginibacter sp.]|uniref:hypothetical protein n=1 Tax=uncultured Mucilaginibacter sp. TaxID=797541 RepID=UPI0025FD9E08|nr:hypothetical protein [uncultured Mucilaginibacter sp.]